MKYDKIVERARKIHGDKYTYPPFDEIPVGKKMKIICPIHGEFEQTAFAHMKGQGCPKCVGEKRGYTTEDFIKDAKLKFGDKFDYSKTEYTGRRNKVLIMCKDFITDENPNGEFWQLPFNHLKSKDGFPFMGERGRKYGKISDEEQILKKTKKFIEKAKQIHGDKYDYSKAVYNGCFQKICIVCPKHGEFWQLPGNHIKGCNCPTCSNKTPITKDEFIKKANEIHNFKFDYSKVVIGKSNDKVCIICPEHGEFWQTTSNHLRGRGCIKCSRNKKLTTEEFIEKSKSIHGDKYDYSKVEYVNNATNVIITCKKHGDFKQLPSVHLYGGGCPICNESHMENELSLLFNDNNIRYERQKTFETIKYKKELPFDFYLPDYNVVIECQGEQHFKKHHFFNDENRFEKDKIKYEGCLNNNIKILYYTNYNSYKKYFNEIYNENNTFNNKIKLLNEIIKQKNTE